MPPPSFSSQSSFQVHAPRGTVALLKEATQAVYAHLQKGSDGGAAWTALQALLADLHLDTDMSDPEWIHAPEPERSGACAVSYTHLTLPTTQQLCRSRWSPYH